MSHHSARLIRILLVLLMIGYATFFSIQLILHYQSFGSRALDLGNMGQSIWNTSQGRLFHQTNQPGATSRLSLHVEPILIPISLLYYIYPGPEILFIFQSIVVALGAIPGFALARRIFKSDGLALVFAIAYLLMPAVQAATLLDFHAVTLAPTFLLAAFYFMETRRAGYFALFAALAVACKEDITLLVMMMGLYALLINRQRRLGRATLGICAGWAFLAVFVIPPMFAGTENIHWNRYGHLGNSPANIVLNMALQPQLFINHLIAVDAVGYFRLLLAPTAYTALLNPVTLLLALPSLGINLLSNFPPMQRVNSLIYAAPIIPAVMISSIYGTRNLQQFSKWANQRMNEPAVLQFILRHSSFILSMIILAATLIYHAYFGFLPGGGQFRGWEAVTAHHRRSQQIFAQIPAEARLSAQDRLNPHLSRRKTLYIFDRVDDADYIVLDVTQDSWPLHPVALHHRVQQFFEGGFGIVDAGDGYLLLAKNPPDLPTTLPNKFYSFARVSNPKNFSPAYPVNVTFDDKLQLLGYDLTLGAHEKFLPVITLYWRALQPLDKDYALWPFTLDRSGNIIENPAERPLVASIWYPTSRWMPSEIIATSTLPFDLAPNEGDKFTLAVGVATGDWNDPAQRLPISRVDDRLNIFENKSWARLGNFQRTGQKSYRPVSGEPISPQHSRQVQFWNIINLRGVDLPQTTINPGEALPFTLHWQSDAPITVDLTTFAHLIDSSGNAVAQLDWGPQDRWGYLPTSAWNAGQAVSDSQTIPLPNDLPPGQYRLVAGWYYAPTGERLPITGSNSAAPPGNVVDLGTITVK